MASGKLAAVPYQGDDLPQKMAKVGWFPMAAMGLMAATAGLVIAIVAGVSVGDFFGGDTVHRLGRAEALEEVGLGFAFLGMAFILSSVTMVLVNIIRTLRDTGRDVQVAVGASQVTQLAKPLTGKLVPHVMMMGLLVVIAGFVLAIVDASLIGGIDPAGLGDASVLSAGDRADLGLSQALEKWLPPFKLLGLVLIFTSIVLALRTIIKGIRFQAQRVEELAIERGRVAS